MAAMVCPCCGSVLVGAQFAPASIVPDGRVGDRYCPECHWVLAREALDGSISQSCPMHAVPLVGRGGGPGARSRWEAAVAAYGRSRLATRVACIRTTEIQERNAGLRSNLAVILADRSARLSA